MASQITSFLPPIDGWLPKWILLVSVIAIGNSIQAYSTLTYTARVYNGSSSLPSSSTPFKTPTSSSSAPSITSQSPVTPLSARTFGTWTFLSSVLRLYAAYNLDDPRFYQLALWTYIIAFGHFMSEWWIFGTTRWGKGLAGPVFVSTGTLVWMVCQWSYYIKA